MPFTDNNLNKEVLGETQTFAVADRSADALKARINRDNSQALRAKAARQRGSSPAVGPESVQGREASGPTVRPTDRPSVLDAIRAAGAVPAENRAVREQDPGSRGPVRANGYADEDDAKFDRMLRSQEDEPVRRSAPEKRTTSRPVQGTGERRQMAKTRTSDFKVDEVSRASSGKKKKEPEVVYESSDEGGNTVLSLIKAIVYIIFVLISAVALSVFGISVANDMFAFVKSDEAVQVTIPPNATLDELAQILADEGVIRYPRIFKLYAIHKAHDDMEYIAGDYTVSPMTNYSGLLYEFKEKEVTGTVRITIPEGFTTDDIIDLFVNRYGIGTREGFVNVIQNGDFSDYWFVRELEENGVNPNRIYRLDGYLFPDTYDFYLNSSEQTVINRLLRRFSQIFTREYRNQCAELGFTVDQIVTLASMIEKEAAAPSEFFNVSSVFHNRLKIPDVFPRMESDATVVYAIEHDTGERTVDLHYDSPYNTYMYDGLPPGPIANPSASAMLAALMVPETSFYYFVSGNGVTYFSETKEEHDRHIEEIRQAEAALNMVEPDAPQGGDNP